MAKRVDCSAAEVDGILDEHAADWVLVAVVRYVYDPGPREANEEWRELYFEQKTSFGFGKK